MAALRHNRAVTLIEMLVVLGIIVVLAGIVVLVTHRVDSQSRENAVVNAFGLLKSALQEYQESTGKFPEAAPVYDPAVDNPDLASPDAVLERQRRLRAADRITALYELLAAEPASRALVNDIPRTPARGDEEKRNESRPEVPKIRDPWRSPLDYVYVPGDTFPELVSAGPDGLFLRRFHHQDNISSKGTR